MLTLYHIPIAICAQKTRVCLAEKGVAWDSMDVNGKFRDPEYLKLNPNGYVPTIVDDGKVVTESRVISEYIDEKFAGPALQPTDAYERSVMRRWTKQIDESLHPFIFVLSFVPLFRDRIMRLSADEQRKSMPLDPVKAERMQHMMKWGWDSHYLDIAVGLFTKLAIDMETTLERSAWLAGDSYSLADADYTPYIQRMEDIGLGWLLDERPALTNWYARVRNRPSFSAVIRDWVSPEERRVVDEKVEELAFRYKSVFNRLDRNESAC